VVARRGPVGGMAVVLIGVGLRWGSSGFNRVLGRGGESRRAESRSLEGETERLSGSRVGGWGGVWGWWISDEQQRVSLWGGWGL